MTLSVSTAASLRSWSSSLVFATASLFPLRDEIDDGAYKALEELCAVALQLIAGEKSGIGGGIPLRIAGT